MKEIFPSIYQMTLTLSGFNPGSINVYLIRDKEGYTIIDTGWDSPPSVQSMEEQLAEYNIRLVDIKRVIVTHCHVDHLGMTGSFKKSHNATIYLHQNELPLIKMRFNNGDQFIPMTDRFLQQHGMPEEELTPPEIQIPNVPNLTPPDVILKGGEEIIIGEYLFQVINTPGHTPGHISLLETQKKFLLSGDTLLPTIITNAAIHVQHIENPIQLYIGSLRKLYELDIDLVLPGHEYVFSHHQQRIEEIIRHYQRKSEDILRAFSDGQSKTAYDVSRILASSPKTKSNVWPSLSGWDKRFAALQTVAHLEALTFADKITRFSQDGKIYYR
jgi:glyoxylase-like metal-dependent hydrolase (beta-lactamase superfamily II)